MSLAKLDHLLRLLFPVDAWRCWWCCVPGQPLTPFQHHLPTRTKIVRYPLLAPTNNEATRALLKAFARHAPPRTRCCCSLSQARRLFASSPDLIPPTALSSARLPTAGHDATRYLTTWRFHTPTPQTTAPLFADDPVAPPLHRGLFRLLYGISRHPCYCD